MFWSPWEKLLSPRYAAIGLSQLPAKTFMSKQLLVRNVPNDTCTWIDRQRGLTDMSQQEVVLSVLGRAVQDDLEATMPLFGTPH